VALPRMVNVVMLWGGEAMRDQWNPGITQVTREVTHRSPSVDLCVLLAVWPGSVS